MKSGSLLNCEIARFAYADGSAGDTISDVQLDLAAGEVLHIIGPVGAGKSTVLGLCAGLWPKHLRGTFHGTRSVTGENARRDDLTVGYLFQDPDANLVASSVSEEIAIAVDSASICKNGRRDHYLGVIRTFGLEALLEKQTQTLSIGQRQWVAIAACMATEPNLLFLDEPSTHLDAEHRELLKHQLSQYVQGSPDRACMIATHDDSLRWAMGGRSIVLPHTSARTEGTVGIHQPGTASSPRVPLLEARGLSFRYRGGTAVFEDVSLDVTKGDCVLVTGPNGSGKSTLARILAGLQKPTRGTVSLPRADGRSLPDVRYVGYVAQTPGTQLFGRSIGEELKLTPEALAGPMSDAKNRCLSGIAIDRDPMTLSHGQRRRLQIDAFACIPQVLVIDEPPVDWQPCAEDSIRRYVERCLLSGHAVVICTHDSLAWQGLATSEMRLEKPVQGPTSIRRDVKSEHHRSASHPIARVVCLCSLLVGLVAPIPVLAVVTAASIVLLATVRATRLISPLLWTPPIAVATLAFVFGLLSGHSGEPVATVAAIGFLRMYLVCATGLVFSEALSGRDISFLLRQFGVGWLTLAVMAGIEAVPLALRRSTETSWGLRARGLGPRVSRPATLLSGCARITNAIVLLLLEHADRIATLAELRHLKQVGTFLPYRISLLHTLTWSAITLTVLGSVFLL
jgi:energy-coupling factor transporter ATP-binding protein EcfA2